MHIGLPALRFAGDRASTHYNERVSMSEVPSHFADRLFEAIAEKGSPVCVGLDPVYAKLPAELRSPAATLEDEVTAIERDPTAGFIVRANDADHHARAVIIADIS